MRSAPVISDFEQLSIKFGCHKQLNIEKHETNTPHYYLT